MMTLRLTKVLIVLCAGVLGACTTPDTPVEVFDPYEKTNRKVHNFNVGLDRALLRPTSTAYGVVVPRPVRTGVSNFANNIDTPRFMLNDLAQGNIVDAGHNFMRFLVNTTLGVGGIFDPATSFGLETRRTGFGETLHVWGTEEGAYIELPVFGPSNERDAIGTVVDFISNPLSATIDASDDWIPPTANVMDRLGDRYDFADTIDSLFDDSEDSYISARILYIQNRRFELGGNGGNAEFDPFAEFDDDPFAEFDEE
ncbi:MAG: VacJ family lipoprotein [Pseudomonadota bacterium]